MRKVSPHIIIHAFALLHLATSVICRLAGVNDELLLTLLTMIMIVLICLRKNLSEEISASIVVLVNLFGFLLGTYGARLIALVFSSEIVIHGLSTLVTTELIGWVVWAVGSLLSRLQPVEAQAYAGSDTIYGKHSEAESGSVYGETEDTGLEIPDEDLDMRAAAAERDVSAKGRRSAAMRIFSKEEPYRMRWLIVVIASIFFLRILIIVLNSLNQASSGSHYTMTSAFTSNSPAIITMFCLNLIFVRIWKKSGKNMKDVRDVLIVISFILSCALIGVLMALPRMNATYGRLSSPYAYVSLGVIVLVSEVLMFIIVQVVDYVLRIRKAAEEEKAKRHKAQYEYVKLKQQVNPHFLFNSLNVLDAMVQEGQDEEASNFIHKLAGMYRYLLKHEGSALITLREEKEFTDMFLDLMLTRFPAGFEVKRDVPEECYSKKVVPCAVQMLVENVFKHNVVSEADPLIIEVRADGDEITVSNVVKPKLSRSVDSTNVGLKYIQQQYKDLTGKNISVKDDGIRYEVTLPLVSA